MATQTDEHNHSLYVHTQMTEMYDMGIVTQ